MSDTWAERIIEALRISRLPLDDDQLARRLGASQRQTINQTCRRLETDGVLRRDQGADGKIVNSLVISAPETTSPRPAAAPREARPLPRLSPTALLTEDQVKAAVKCHLEAEGWTVRVAWGHERGIDISAHRDHHLYIEAKGEAANPPSRSTTSSERSASWFSGSAIPTPNTASRCRTTSSTAAWSTGFRLLPTTGST